MQSNLAKSAWVIIMITVTVQHGLEICVTKSGNECKCTNDGQIILCVGARLQNFPLFNSYFMNNAQELHLSNNNISVWPNPNVWKQYEKLTYIDITHNPVCIWPQLEKQIDIDISPCK